MPTARAGLPAHRFHKKTPRSSQSGAFAIPGPPLEMNADCYGAILASVRKVAAGGGTLVAQLATGQ